MEKTKDLSSHQRVYNVI